MACGTLKRPLESDPLFSPNRRPAKRSRLTSRILFDSPNCSASTSPRDDFKSPFASAASRLTPEQMQLRLRNEIRHLRRLKQFGLITKEGSSPQQCSSAALSQSSSPGFSGALENFGESMKLGVGVSKDAPLFTFKQVGLICERMLQEREDTLRREYEHVLSTKLAEQYDTFVKFTHDQIQKRFEAASAPSYLS